MQKDSFVIQKDEGKVFFVAEECEVAQGKKFVFLGCNKNWYERLHVFPFAESILRGKKVKMPKLTYAVLGGQSALNYDTLFGNLIDRDGVFKGEAIPLANIYFDDLME